MFYCCNFRFVTFCFLFCWVVLLLGCGSSLGLVLCFSLSCFVWWFGSVFVYSSLLVVICLGLIVCDFACSGLLAFGFIDFLLQLA